MTRRVCFVTFEIAPFTGGGIGTWLRNTLETYASPGSVFEVLLFGQPLIETTAFATVFPGVVLHQIDLEKISEGTIAPGQAGRPDFDSFAAWRSYGVMRALQRLERETGAFDVIEFIDWSGVAFYTIKEKQMQRSFQSACISVRLHGSEGLLRAHETRAWHYENLVIADLERQALRDADLTVAHLEATADSYQRHYAFDAEWRRRCRVELPPVKGVHNVRTIAVSLDTPILFTSKFQEIKRPEIFIRGVSAFVGDTPEYRGSIMFAALDGDATVREDIRASIPDWLAPRVKFLPAMPHEAREKLIASSIVVFPNSYETFCFAAYEANAAGAITLVNAHNSAFGEATPWIDGVNCLKFDGTSVSLQNGLTRLYRAALGGAPAINLRPLHVEAAAEPYWTKPNAEPEKPVAAGPGDATRITVIVPHRNFGAALKDTVAGLLATATIPIEIIVVDDSSDDPVSDLVLSHLEALSRSGGPLRVIRRRGSVSNQAVCIRIGVSHARAPLVAILQPDTHAAAGFLDSATNVLSDSANVDLVVPAIKLTQAAGRSEQLVPLGEAVHCGLFSNRLVWGVFAARRSVLESLPPDETLMSDWSWDLLLRAAMAGHRFAVDLDAGVTRQFNPGEQATVEWRRRRGIEGLRRRFSVQHGGARVLLNVLGDGELYTAERHLGAQIEHACRERDEALAALHGLRTATSVRVALAAATRISHAMPWLHRHTRRIVRRRTDAA